MHPICCHCHRCRWLPTAECTISNFAIIGQNVNGFHDTSEQSALIYHTNTLYSTSSPGFTNLFQSRSRERPGARFSDLLLSVADISPNLRVRFTSPHPKDFPRDVLAAVASRPNICASLHLPAQSGSNSVLSRMRRGYTREAYLQLVDDVRRTIPNVTISTDIIVGFCGETEEEHADTVLLMEQVKFDQAFMFAYSLREKTHAARTMEDDVPEATKLRRLQEVIATFRGNIIPKNEESEAGALRLVLVEGLSSKATSDNPTLTGRTDGNQRVVFNTINGQGTPVLKRFDCSSSMWDDRFLTRGEVERALADADTSPPSTIDRSNSDSETTCSSGNHSGKYMVVKILEARTTTLRGVAIGESSIAEWYQRGIGRQVDKS
jgi:tRNA A37 methylthiotransferase MiaB